MNDSILGDKPMEIVTGWPPNIDLIRSVFPVSGNTVFAYGEIIYSPQGDGITPDLIYHEHVHRKQQALLGSPELWWNQYLSDVDFRLSQEVEAYHEQWKWIKRHIPDRFAKMKLTEFAAQLSSPLYQLNITQPQAETMIRKYGTSN